VTRWEPVLALRDGVELAETDSGGLTLTTAWSKLPLESLSPGLRAGLLVLRNGGGTADAIADAAIAAEPGLQLAQLYFRLDRLASRSLLSASAVSAGRALARAVPITRGARLTPVDLDAPEAVRLSRFAYVRRRGDGLAVESPLSRFRVELLDPDAAAVVARLARPFVADGDEDRACVALLRAAGIATAEDEDADVALAQTEFHDLLYHRRSRRGWTDEPIGATFLHLDAIPPQPALRPRHAGATLPLPAADVDALARDDVPFTRVLESRRSVRAYDEEHPLDLATLGAFLYRTARVRAVMPPEPGAPYETSSRPYPSGGATYDLEIYLTVRTCTGLEPGIYHYVPDEHALTLVTAEADHVDAMLQEAWIACAQQVVPQALVTLSTRFARLNWKYSGMAYAATLKNVGVLYQTMYLVATAMGLAPCALGNGNAVLFADATGIDPAVESSVGEFMLGSLPPG
jgi:SagB-type dehydrogenase family enzyme